MESAIVLGTHFQFTKTVLLWLGLFSSALASQGQRNAADQIDFLVVPRTDSGSDSADVTLHGFGGGILGSTSDLVAPVGVLRPKVSGPDLLPGRAYASPLGVVVTPSLLPSGAPEVLIGGRPWRRINLYFGSVFLSDHLTLREAMRFVPGGLTSERRRQYHWGASAAGSARDSYPSLVFGQCDPASCSGYDSQRHRYFATRTAIETVAGQSGNITVGQSFVAPKQGGVADGQNHLGDSGNSSEVLAAENIRQKQALGSSASWGFWGLDLHKDLGGGRVIDDGNTVLTRTDDRLVELRNNDWSRVAAAHSSAAHWPAQALRGRVSLFASEIDEGLSRGPQSIGESSRSFGRIGLAEATLEKILPQDATVVGVTARGLVTERWDSGGDSLWRGSRVKRSGDLWSVGVTSSTPYSRLLGLRQLRMGLDLEGSRSHRTSRRSGNATKVRDSAAEMRFNTRAGAAIGLGALAGIDYELGLGVALQGRFARTRSSCDLGVEGSELCASPATEAGSGGPFTGVTLRASRDFWLLEVYGESLGREPTLVERYGGPVGVLANPALREERRTAAGILLAFPWVSFRLESSRELNPVTMQKTAGTDQRFVNDGGNAFHQLTSKLELDGTGDGPWALGLEHSFTRAYRLDRPNLRVPRVPGQAAEARLRSPDIIRSVATEAPLGASLQLFGAVGWQSDIPLDRENLAVLEDSWTFEPGVAINVARGGGVYSLDLGSRFSTSFGEGAGDGIGGSFEQDLTQGGQPESLRANFRARLRGSF
jgi:hypothetical protein